MKSEFFTGTVEDDVHRDESGAVIPDGGLKLVVPGLFGAGRDGWGTHVVGWIRPMFARVWTIPTKGSDVMVIRYASGELRWIPWEPEGDLPSWLQGNYPDRTGFQSRTGLLQVVLDEKTGAVHLAEFDAEDPLTLHPGLKDYINSRIAFVFNGHVHPIALLSVAPVGTPVVTVDPASAVTGVPSTTIQDMTTEGESTKVKGV